MDVKEGVDIVGVGGSGTFADKKCERSFLTKDGG
jgi:hypothetical protein